MSPPHGTDQLFLAGNTVLVMAAALQDLFRRRIADLLTGAMAICALGYFTTVAPGQIPYHVANAFVVFCGGALLFRSGMMGGGDVKMLTALALWFTRQQLPLFIILTMMAGGVLGAIFLARTMLVRRFNPEHHMVAGVPYGLAIAGGFSIAVGQLL